MTGYKINIFKNATDADCSNEVYLETVLKAIKTGRWKDEIELIRYVSGETRDKAKKKLPAVTFSGTFNKKRLDINIKFYTGIIVLDIDKLPADKIKRLKSDLINDEYCFCFFDSPSLGLKCMFEVDISEEFHKDYSFAQIKEYFENKYNIPVDPSGSNLSRLCFVSYDPEMYYRPGKLIFPVDKNREEEQFVAVLKYKVKSTGVQNMDHSMKICRAWVEKSGCYYVKGQRNLYLYKLCCHLNRAGFTTEDMIYYIYKEHSISKEMSKELVSCARSAAKNKNEFNTRPIWQRTSQKNLFTGESSQTESN